MKPAMSFAVFSVVLTCGCAQVTVSRVPTGTTDDVQKKRDAMEGFRYYLTRPYVAVKKPFPLHGDVYVVNGKAKNVGGQIIIESIDVEHSTLPDDVKKTYFPSGKIASREVQVQLPPTPPPKPAKADDTGTGKPGPDNAGQQTPKDSSPSDTSGSAKSGSSSDPVLKLNDVFDVVLLPDFDEQYAIKVTPGVFGKADMNLMFRDGCMLESATTSQDNSQIVQGVFDTIGKLITAAGGAAGTAASPTKAAATTTLDKVAPTGLHVEVEGGLLDIVLRVSVFTEAEPGLYPLLKGQERANTTTDSKKPEAHYLSLPFHPYTVVPFNTMKSVGIELVSPAVSPKPEATTQPPKPPQTP